ncbi:ankyrin and armadillo repeat-containing -like [Brachionus plicatilis]|uniref:Ankyrin and armadillo repeat-containing-like n=1 Tax=Brachionus plicatilis TaxID=10195 RepID=A0A3M7P162_BRAPC|nr:ankyrin and armadillo repeat-containing -like [Brachionus plicatilis]
MADSSGLAHTRTGITDAMLTCDAVDILCDRLYSPNDQIRFASAITLGYLSFNRTASRLLLHNCRNYPHLYKTLMTIIPSNAKISKQFVQSFQTSLALGLPKLLVHNQVKFYEVTGSPKVRDDFKGFYLGKELNRTNFSKLSFYDIDNTLNKNSQGNLKAATSRSQSAPLSKHIKNIHSKNPQSRNATMLEIKKSNKLST